MSDVVFVPSALFTLAHTWFVFVLSGDLSDRLEDCRGFLRRHGALLSSWPALFVQQALNEPPDTPAHTWAQSLARGGHEGVVEWLNNPGAVAEVVTGDR